MIGEPLPGTEPLTLQGDLAMQMVAGIDAFLMAETQAQSALRSQAWKRDFSSPAAYETSLAEDRAHFGRLIGLQDKRDPVHLQVECELHDGRSVQGERGRGTHYRIYAVRWNVFRGVEAEGLLLLPDQAPKADIVALPDCDTLPEQLVGLEPGLPPEAQFARRLAEAGCRVLVPLLINRADTYSGIPAVRMTNQPHREFLYRAAYEMGRHPIGYEVQKVLAVVDWFRQTLHSTLPCGVMGYGEGGLLAFYAAALDTRIQATVVSGYFQSRETLWQEPIYRNVFGLLERFDDAWMAQLVLPRHLIVESSSHPQVAGPPPVREGRSGAAPGRLETPPSSIVQAEFQRAQELAGPWKSSLQQMAGRSGLPGETATLRAFLKTLGVTASLPASHRAPKRLTLGFDPAPRLQRQFQQILEDTQSLMRESPYRRAEFWKQADVSSVEAWNHSVQFYRDYFWDRIIGRLPAPKVPPHPRSRLVYDTPHYRGYEVTLDVYPGVYAYGILLVPKNLQEGERRAVVVCQHGLEGRPQDVADPAIESPYYHQYACRLAEKGYITFSPQNPYIGEDTFRVLLRKAQPLGKTLFSVIVRQHERILDWLATLPFVDPQRMAFYGLSYGGKTAMRVPALLERYCLSICSADYNEWIWKNVSARSGYSYLVTGEYDMPEFDLGNTFNYAEMSWLIFPRPFMVERGHHDGVAPDEWVAYEFARTRRHYVLLGQGDRTEIAFFNGPHSIHGVETFAFLDRFLHGP